MTKTEIKHARKLTRNIFKGCLAESDVSGVPSKYRSFTKNFDRYFRILIQAKKMGFKKGIDFGCGTGMGVLVGKALEMEVVGIDCLRVTHGWKKNVPFDTGSSIENPYASVQDSINKLGMKIARFETNKPNWNFQDSEFDFALAFASLFEDYTPDSHHNHLKTISKAKTEFSAREVARQLDHDAMIMNTRILELSRILKPHALMWVGPLKMYNAAQYYNSELTKKKQKFMFWKRT